ncbi:hypothetical protein BVRB_013920, partial [Beta vulgaris subsp. vulgaris]
VYTTKRLAKCDKLRTFNTIPVSYYVPFRFHIFRIHQRS